MPVETKLRPLINYDRDPILGEPDTEGKCVERYWLNLPRQ